MYTLYIQINENSPINNKMTVGILVYYNLRLRICVYKIKNINEIHASKGSYLLKINLLFSLLYFVVCIYV